MKIPHRILIAAIVAGSCWLSAATARADDDPVTVDKQGISASTLHYNPHNPPSEMPPRTPHEAGVTISEFGCGAVVSGTVTDHYQQGPDIFATVKIDTVQVKLTLKIVEWIDETAPDKITAHEDGHRKISEQFYENADKEAATIAKGLIGQTVTAAGSDLASASQNALHSAAMQVTGAYTHKVSETSQWVQEAYDRITSHGTNDVPESDAIEQAMSEVKNKQK